jgi:hypothetical protein
VILPDLIPDVFCGGFDFTVFDDALKVFFLLIMLAMFISYMTRDVA